MAKKLFLIIIFLFAFYLLISNVSACSGIMEGVSFNIKTPELSKCFFYSYNDILTSDMNVIEFIEDKTKSISSVNCDALILTEDEQDIFRNVINQYNRGVYSFSSSFNIEKQSNQEYINLQEQIRKANSDKCDCKRYEDVNRYDDWTVYVELMDCRRDTACRIIPPEGCINGLTYNHFNKPNYNPIILILISIAGIIGIIFFIRFIIKRSKRK